MSIFTENKTNIDAYGQVVRNVNNTQSYYTTLRQMNPARYYKLSNLKQMQEDYAVLGHRKFLELESKKGLFK